MRYVVWTIVLALAVAMMTPLLIRVSHWGSAWFKKLLSEATNETNINIESDGSSGAPGSDTDLQPSGSDNDRAGGSGPADPDGGSGQGNERRDT